MSTKLDEGMDFLPFNTHEAFPRLYNPIATKDQPVGLFNQTDDHGVCLKYPSEKLKAFASEFKCRAVDELGIFGTKTAAAEQTAASVLTTYNLWYRGVVNEAGKKPEADRATTSFDTSGGAAAVLVFGYQPDKLKTLNPGWKETTGPNTGLRRMATIGLDVENLIVQVDVDKANENEKPKTQYVRVLGLRNEQEIDCNEEVQPSGLPKTLSNHVPMLRCTDLTGNLVPWTPNPAEVAAVTSSKIKKEQVQSARSSLKQKRMSQMLERKTVQLGSNDSALALDSAGRLRRVRRATTSDSQKAWLFQPGEGKPTQEEINNSDKSVPVYLSCGVWIPLTVTPWFSGAEPDRSIPAQSVRALRWHKKGDKWEAWVPLTSHLPNSTFTAFVVDFSVDVTGTPGKNTTNVVAEVNNRKLKAHLALVRRNRPIIGEDVLHTYPVFGEEVISALKKADGTTPDEEMQKRLRYLSGTTVYSDWTRSEEVYPVGTEKFEGSNVELKQEGGTNSATQFKRVAIQLADKPWTHKSDDLDLDGATGGTQEKIAKTTKIAQVTAHAVPRQYSTPELDSSTELAGKKKIFFLAAEKFVTVKKIPEGITQDEAVTLSEALGAIKNLVVGGASNVYARELKQLWLPWSESERWTLTKQYSVYFNSLQLTAAELFSTTQDFNGEVDVFINIKGFSPRAPIKLPKKTGDPKPAQLSLGAQATCRSSALRRYRKAIIDELQTKFPGSKWVALFRANEPDVLVLRRTAGKGKLDRAQLRTIVSETEAVIPLAAGGTYPTPSNDGLKLKLRQLYFFELIGLLSNPAAYGTPNPFFSVEQSSAKTCSDVLAHLVEKAGGNQDYSTMVEKLAEIVKDPDIQKKSILTDNIPSGIPLGRVVYYTPFTRFFRDMWRFTTLLLSPGKVITEEENNVEYPALMARFREDMRSSEQLAYLTDQVVDLWERGIRRLEPAFTKINRETPSVEGTPTTNQYVTHQRLLPPKPVLPPKPTTGSSKGPLDDFLNTFHQLTGSKRVTKEEYTAGEGETNESTSNVSIVDVVTGIMSGSDLPFGSQPGTEKQTTTDRQEFFLMDTEEGNEGGVMVPDGFMYELEMADPANSVGTARDPTGFRPITAKGMLAAAGGDTSGLLLVRLSQEVKTFGGSFGWSTLYKPATLDHDYLFPEGQADEGKKRRNIIRRSLNAPTRVSRDQVITTSSEKSQPGTDLGKVKDAVEAAINKKNGNVPPVTIGPKGGVVDASGNLPQTNGSGGPGADGTGWGTDKNGMYNPFRIQPRANSNSAKEIAACIGKSPEEKDEKTAVIQAISDLMPQCVFDSEMGTADSYQVTEPSAGSMMAAGAVVGFGPFYTGGAAAKAKFNGPKFATTPIPYLKSANITGCEAMNVRVSGTTVARNRSSCNINKLDVRQSSYQLAKARLKMGSFKADTVCKTESTVGAFSNNINTMSQSTQVSFTSSVDDQMNTNLTDTVNMLNKRTHKTTSKLDSDFFDKVDKEQPAPTSIFSTVANMFGDPPEGQFRGSEQTDKIIAAAIGNAASGTAAANMMAQLPKRGDKNASLALNKITNNERYLNLTERSIVQENVQIAISEVVIDDVDIRVFPISKKTNKVVMVSATDNSGNVTQQPLLDENGYPVTKEEVSLECPPGVSKFDFTAEANNTANLTQTYISADQYDLESNQQYRSDLRATITNDLLDYTTFANRTRSSQELTSTLAGNGGGDGNWWTYFLILVVLLLCLLVRITYRKIKYNIAKKSYQIWNLNNNNNSSKQRPNNNGSEQQPDENTNNSEYLKNQFNKEYGRFQWTLDNQKYDSGNKNTYLGVQKAAEFQDIKSRNPWNYYGFGEKDVQNGTVTPKEVELEGGLWKGIDGRFTNKASLAAFFYVALVVLALFLLAGYAEKFDEKSVWNITKWTDLAGLVVWYTICLWGLVILFPIYLNGSASTFSFDFFAAGMLKTVVLPLFALILFVTSMFLTFFTGGDTNFFLIFGIVLCVITGLWLVVPYIKKFPVKKWLSKNKQSTGPQTIPNKNK